MTVSLILASLTACSSKPLEHAIAEQVAEGDGATVRMSRITKFEWDRLHIFGPYVTEETIEDELGFDWARADDPSFYMADENALLVFVRDGRVVKSLLHPRSEGDFADLDGRGGYTPREAQFVVDESDGDYPKLVLQRG